VRYFLLLTRPLSGFLALVALVAVGCGGASELKNDYVKHLNRAQATLQTSLTGLGDDLGPGAGGAQLAARLEASAKAIDAVAEDFGAVVPPQDARHAHDKIVDGLHKLGGTFRGAARAAKANDLAMLTKTLQDFERTPGAREIQQAQAELEANGYRVDGS
jgi:hypothetical protein